MPNVLELGAWLASVWCASQVVPWISWLIRLGLAMPVGLSALTPPAQPQPTPLRHHHVHHRTYGADVSWPNCPKGAGIKHRRTQGQPMPGRRARFVVVGVTNGPGFHPNPCLAGQLAWVKRHHRRLGGYAMTTYPQPRQLRRYGAAGPFPTRGALGRLSNAGYAEAAYNIRTMTRLGMKVPMLWVDVEPYPFFPWTANHTANRAVVRGAIRRYREAGLRIGLYTYANGWRAVVGNWRLPGFPAWATAGHTNARHARAMCGHRGPSGGRTWIAQWYTTHQDFDVLCRKAPRDTSRIFR
jgi:hypothetical protein